MYLQDRKECLVSLLYLTAHPYPWNYALYGWIFMKFDVWEFLGSLPRKLKFNLNWTRVTDTLNEDQYIYIYIYIWPYFAQFFLKWEIFQTNVDKINTHFKLNNIYFFKICAIWDNIETNIELDRPQMTIWCMITNATNTCSE